MPENSFRPRMLNQYPDLNSFMEDVKQKLADAYATGSADRVEAVDKALAGRSRNYGLLSEYENERQAVLNRARQYAQARKEQEQQANAERLANFKGLMAGPITDVREVGPAGYQPGYQGGMDFASLQDMVPPPPDNKYAKSLLDGLNQGSQKAKEQNRTSTLGFFSDAREGVSSLLGGLGEALSSPFAQRILAIMARPEFQDPRGISAGIVGAAAGLKEDEKAAAKLKREEQRLANEAAQLDFLNKLKLAQARRDEERLSLAQEAAGKPKGTALPFSKEFGQGVENLVKSIAADYISDEAGYVPFIYGPYRREIVSEIAAEARSLVAASGNTKTIRQAIEEVVARRQGKTPPSGATTATAPQSANARLNVTQER